MATSTQNVVIILKTGKSDNGKSATLAFSCALSALAMGHATTVFLTGDGAVWGYTGSASGICVQGFPDLEQLIQQCMSGEGRLILCSVCYKTCSSGGPDDRPQIEMLPGAEIGGFATVLELANQGTTVTF